MILLRTSMLMCNTLKSSLKLMERSFISAESIMDNKLMLLLKNVLQRNKAGKKLGTDVDFGGKSRN